MNLNLKPFTEFKGKNSLKFLVEVAEILLIFFALSWFAKTYMLTTIQITDQNMLPTLEPGNKILVDKFLYQNGRQFERGDLVVLTDGTVRRVVGTEDDQIEVKSGFIYVNKRPFFESYTKTPRTFLLEPFTVPAGQLFVLDDNRTAAYDSSDGLQLCIPEKDAAGRALLRYWPLTGIKFF